MSKDESTKINSDRKSTICFICNSLMILLIIVLCAWIMHFLTKDRGFILFVSLLLFFPCAFFEEHCISKYINISIERIYKKIIQEKQK